MLQTTFLTRRLRTCLRRESILHVSCAAFDDATRPAVPQETIQESTQMDWKVVGWSMLLIVGVSEGPHMLLGACPPV